MAASSETVTPSASDARGRILDAAYDLFSHRGIRAVGIEELLTRADVAKATFYRHFPSKEDLVLEFLKLREQVWAHEWVVATAKERGSTAEEQLLVIFDLFSEWFAYDDFEGCSFINVLLETADRHNPVHQACTTALRDLRSVLSDLAAEAGLRDPDEFALSWHILMKGSIVQAAEGDLDAGRRAQAMGRMLIDHHR